VPQWYGPLGGVALIGALGLTTDMALELWFPLLFLPVLVVRYRGLNPAPLRADWWRRCLLTSMTLGAVSWAIYKGTLLLRNHADLSRRSDALAHVRVVIENIGPITWLVVFALFAAWAARRTQFARGFQGVMIAVVLVTQGAMALLPTSSSFRENYTRYGRDIRFVQEFLRQRQAPAVPTIYSCLGRPDLVWLDLHAQSYFDWWQLSGVMFQRQTALEGQRRALAVGPFELNRFRELGAVQEITRRQVSRLFALDYDTAQPTLDDLKKLCQEDGLDFLLLTHEFPGLAAAGNGRVFIYDCRQVRAALGNQSPPMAARLGEQTLQLSPAPPYR
jgi:hypothetical protein